MVYKLKRKQIEKVSKLCSSSSKSNDEEKDAMTSGYDTFQHSHQVLISAKEKERQS